MLDTLKAWLNGTREFNTGAQLYNHLGKDQKLKALFAQGYTLYNNYRLQEELKAICADLKREKKATATTPPVATGDASKLKHGYLPKQKAEELNEIISSMNNQVTVITNSINPPNPELYKACKAEADALYKEAMNKRAVLFSMVPDNKYEDPNRTDLVASRKDLALEVVRLYNRASELYDRADHVKLHGRLPDQETVDLEEEIAQLLDHEVKPTLDNARKAYNKLKGKEQTAERLALMQKHEAKIKALEERWHSLKQGK